MVRIRTALGIHQPPIELNDPAYSEVLILGERYAYRLTERGKQLLEETGLRCEMTGMVKLYNTQLHLEPTFEPSSGLPYTKKCLLSLGIRKLCEIASRYEIPADVLMGTVITGLQDLYVELYGLPQPEPSPK
jgi:hypothetical protein